MSWDRDEIDDDGNWSPAGCDTGNEYGQRDEYERQRDEDRQREEDYNNTPWYSR